MWKEPSFHNQANHSWTADHHADAEQRPAQLAEKGHYGLHPGQLEEFHAHHAHDGKKIPQESHQLTVEPVHEVAHDRVRYKIPDKDLIPPPFLLCVNTQA